VVDELSLLVTPVADGGQGEPALFDVEGARPAKAVASLNLKSAKRIGADMVWLRYGIRKSRA
jgi:riboflavin biosynthesis pyrimidine reductase